MGLQAASDEQRPRSGEAAGSAAVDADDDQEWWDDDDGYEEEDDFAYDCTWDGVPGHHCGAIGSEDCDWDCPLSREMWAGLRGESIEEE